MNSKSSISPGQATSIAAAAAVVITVVAAADATAVAAVGEKGPRAPPCHSA